MTEPADQANHPDTFWQLLWRYFSFVWMFEEVPARADRFVHASIVRSNRNRGLRFLPRYMRRYLRITTMSAMMGWASEAMAAPALVAGTCFTCSSVAGIALLVALIGYSAMRWRAFDHARF
ncbi:MAG: hypothetical protein R3E87_10210 [Burkholderiaceae bacterium]